MLSMSVFACACIACMHDATISSTAPAVEINNECQFVQATATLRLFMTIPHSVAIRYIPLHKFLPLAAYTVFHWIWMPATFIAGIKRCHNCRHFRSCSCQFSHLRNIFSHGAWSNHPRRRIRPAVLDDSICGCLSSHWCGEEELWGHDLQSDELQTMLPTF